MKRNQRPFALTGAIIVLTVIVFVWWRSHTESSHGSSARTILYYQDSMHPWIKSDQPGKCTVCSMDLTAIYEGEHSAELDGDTIVLNRSSVTVLNVQTEEVQRQPLVMTIRVSGTLEADETRTTVFASPSVGRIESMEVEYAGIEVEEGQRLLTFYSPELVALRRQYVVRGHSIVSLSQTTPLGTRESAQTTSGLPKLGSRLTGRLGPSENISETDPYYCDLLAPQSGTVVDRNVFPGQYVAEGEPIFTIVDMSVLWFRFDVYERQLPWLRVGQELRISVPGAPGRDFRAVISWIEPTVHEKTRTAKVRAEVPNPREGSGDHAQHLLKLGMYADGWVRAEVSDVVSVPRAGILFPGGQAYAYVERSPGAYTMRPVKLGRQGDARWEVLEGLEVGDRVVTAGNVLIDAQAQFTRSPSMETGASAEPGSMEAMVSQDGVNKEGVSTMVVSFRPEQTAALNEFFEAAVGISAALAADDMAALQLPVAQTRDRAPALKAAFAEGHPWHELVGSVAALVDWPAVKDLESARAFFLPFSIAVVELVQHARAGHPDLGGLKVYFCPMAPGLGLWFQSDGPLANPFYGAKMLRCGEEVEVPRSLLAAAKSLRHAKPVPNPEMRTHRAHATREQPMPVVPSSAHAEAETMGAVVPVAVQAASQPSEADPIPLENPEEKAALEDVPSPPKSRVRWEPTRSHNSRSPERMDRLEAVVAARLTQRQIDQKTPAATVQQEAAETGAMQHLGTTVANRLHSLPAGKPDDATSPQTASAVPLTNDQGSRVRAVIDLAARLSESLAADDLPAFNQQVTQFPASVQQLAQSFPSAHPWRATVQALAACTQAATADSLESARAQFLEFSPPAVELGKLAIRSSAAVAGVKLYFCPMAPKPGVWLQSGAPLRNPYFGKKMLGCGEEIAL